jgi:hypothetical protein
MVAVGESKIDVSFMSEIVRQFFQRYSAGDIPGAISLFQDDASYWFASTRETLSIGQLAGGLKWVQSRLDGPIRHEIGTIVAERNKITVQDSSVTLRIAFDVIL